MPMTSSQIKLKLMVRIHHSKMIKVFGNKGEIIYEICMNRAIEIFSKICILDSSLEIHKQNVVFFPHPFR